MNDYEMDLVTLNGCKLKVAQVRMSSELLKKAQMCLKDDEITLSFFIRSVLKRYINNRQQLGCMEKTSDLDSFDKLDRAVREVAHYLPIVKENPYFRKA